MTILFERTLQAADLICSQQSHLHRIESFSRQMEFWVAPMIPDTIKEMVVSTLTG